MESNAVTSVGRRSSSFESVRPSDMTSHPPPSVVLDFNSSRVVKRMSFLRLLCLNAIVCGIEFCGSAAFCFIPPLLLKTGIGEQNMSLVLGVGPLVGFFVVPLIGRWSDKCHSKYGRRRPFIFVLSVILVFSLVVLMSAKFVASSVASKDLGWVVSVTLLVVGSIFLDFTCQVCLTPCEALLSDLSKDTDQHGRCFTVYSFMVSFGGCVGYLITALDWSDNFFGSYFDSQENCIFFLLIILFSVSFVFTFVAAKEVPLSELQKLSDAKKSGQTKPNRPVVDTHYKNDFANSLNGCLSRNDSIGTSSRSVLRRSVARISSLKTYFMLKLYSILPDGLKQLLDVPLALRRLALANFCSWTSVMIFNLFYTDFVGQAIYRGDPNAAEGSDLRKLYDEGVRMGSWGLLWHCMLSAVYAPFIERIISKFNLQIVYFIGMASFTISVFFMMFSANILVANLCATCTGFGYATLTTVPYLLLTSYHDNLEVFFCDTHKGFGIPNRGMGTDLSTLDSAYFLSQVMLTSFMGYIVQKSGSVASYVVCSFIMGLVSLYCISKIVHKPHHMSQYLSVNKVAR